MIKLSNATPGALALDPVNKRLYCAAREGLLLIFSIKRDRIVMVHALPVVMNPSPYASFIKQLWLDTGRNLLIARMATGIEYFIQLIRPPNENKACIIEMVDNPALLA